VAYYLQGADTAASVDHGLHEHIGSRVISADFVEALRRLKLGRSVALKFLFQDLTSNAVALQRLEREAQAASSLNHPNICTIHAIEEHEAQPFIVMELLEGETLRSRMAALELKASPFDELLERC